MTGSVSELFREARLLVQDAPREALGEIVIPRRILGVARPPRVVPAGTAWHLGALLLGDEAVWATGDIVRAREEAPRGFTAQSQRDRAALAGAAFRGGFAEGRTVHVGWAPIDLPAVERGETSGPLAVRDGIPSIRWSTRGGWMPLEAYLRERVALLREPPAGA